MVSKWVDYLQNCFPRLSLNVSHVSYLVDPLFSAGGTRTPRSTAGVRSDINKYTPLWK